MNWKPIKHAIVRNGDLQSKLHEVGFVKAGTIGDESLNQLKALYKQLHGFKQEDGGMFYSLYSKDLVYRKTVNDNIERILKETYDNLFVDYKTVINSYIAKLSGPKSDFTLHQDSTGLDETKHSPLSIWIPLQDTDINNGTLCLIPKTHAFFHIYRGISFDAPFKEYESTLRKYLIPITLKAGEILMFDNRLVHYSGINHSEQPRVVVMSGLFPKEADIISVYKDSTITDAPLEIYRQTDDFLITNTAFFENCTARPYRGDVVASIKDTLEKKTVYDFMSWASRNDVAQQNIPELMDLSFNMQIVSEPV